MQLFSTADLETLTDISAPTLRLWEKRYWFAGAKQRNGSQRVYSKETLQNLLAVSFLYQNGWKAAAISTLTGQEILAEVEKIPIGQASTKSFVQRLFVAAINLNEAAFADLLSRLILEVGFEKTMLEVCFPYLAKLRKLWQSTRLVPVEEHFSLYLIKNRLISETEKFSAVQNESPEIVLFSPDTLGSDLSLLFLNFLLRKAGRPVLYLGDKTRLHDISQAARVPTVRYLYGHLFVSSANVFVDDYFETLRKAFPKHTLVASGRGVENSQRTFVNLYLLKSDDEIRRFINKTAGELKQVSDLRPGKL